MFFASKRGAAECALLCLQPVPSRGLLLLDAVASFYGINDVVLAAHLFTVHRRKTIKYERGEGARKNGRSERALFFKPFCRHFCLAAPYPAISVCVCTRVGFHC